MSQTLLLLQTGLALAVISLILVQARGTGFGRGSASSFTRRGVERLIFKLTIFLVGFFLLISLARLLV